MLNNFCGFEGLIFFDLWILDSGFRIPESGIRIPDSGFRIPDCGFRIADCGFRIAVSDSGIRNPDFGFLILGLPLELCYRAVFTWRHQTLKFKTRATNVLVLIRHKKF